MTERANVTSADIVGQEGLGQTVAAVAQQVSALEKGVNFQFSALSQSQNTAIDSLRREADMSHEAIRLELAMAIDRLDLQIVEAWSAHKHQHSQEQRAVEVAVSTMDKRLDSMNEFRATLTDQASRFATNATLDSEKVDTRRRFEMLESKINQLEKEMGVELRREVRPVQDARVGQAAVIAAIGVGVTLILFAIAIANYIGG